VHEAARRLGISEDAVRMRVKRKTLKSDREGGRLYVLLDEDPTTDPTDRTDELLAELRDRVRSLEDQLGQEREAHAEARRIILALTSRIPAIEPPVPSPSAASGSPQDRPEGESATSDTPGQGEGLGGDSHEGRSWWRFWGS
jgi:hypothetical protein